MSHAPVYSQHYLEGEERKDKVFSYNFAKPLRDAHTKKIFPHQHYQTQVYHFQQNLSFQIPFHAYGGKVSVLQFPFHCLVPHVLVHQVK